MRVVVLGAGGVGSVVAGYLARAGHEVTMLARPGHATTIKQRGLQIRGIGDLTVPVLAEAEATGLREADALLVTVKTKDMERALKGVAHLQVGFVASLQNGMVKNEQLASAFGKEKVIGCTTMIGATLVKDGLVEYTQDGVTFFGELDGSRSQRVDEIAHIFNASGLKGEAVDNVVSIEWTKQAIQSPFATLCVLTRLPVHVVWTNRRLAGLSVRMFREVMTVARAKGVELSPHPAWRLDMEIFAKGSFEEAVNSLVSAGERAARGGYTNIIPSMLQDALAGKQTEIEETVGYVAEEGKRLGISVPYTDFVYQTVKAIEESYGDRL